MGRYNIRIKYISIFIKEILLHHDLLSLFKLKKNILNFILMKYPHLMAADMPGITV